MQANYAIAFLALVLFRLNIESRNVGTHVFSRKREEWTVSSSLVHFLASRHGDSPLISSAVENQWMNEHFFVDRLIEIFDLAARCARVMVRSGRFHSLDLFQLYRSRYAIGTFDEDGQLRFSSLSIPEDRIHLACPVIIPYR
jgi:hypothetical protein